MNSSYKTWRDGNDSFDVTRWLYDATGGKKYGKIEIGNKMIPVVNEGSIKKGTQIRFTASTSIDQPKCPPSANKSIKVYIWWTKKSEKFPVDEAQEITIKWHYSCKRHSTEIASRATPVTCCEKGEELQINVIPVYYDE